MNHEQPDEPREPGRIDDEMHTIGVLDVRSADHDLGAFADRVAAMLAEDEPTIIDLSRHDDGGNRISLRTNRVPGEAAP